MTSPMKKCVSCERDLPIDLFGKDQAKKDGLRSYCRECDCRRARERAIRVRDGSKISVNRKLCPRCNIQKANSEFNSYSYSKDGLYKYCKLCTSIMNKKTRGNLKDHEPMVGQKMCPTCKKMKSSDEYYLMRKRKDGLSWECKECTKKRSTLWVKKNPEQKKENDRRNAKKAAIDGRKAEGSDRWRAKNQNYGKEWFQKNKDRMRDYHREYMRLYRYQNQDKINEYKRRWSAKNPEKTAVKDHRRISRKKALPFDIDEQGMAGIFIIFNEMCALCGSSVDLQIDHVIPVSRSDIDNPGTVPGNLAILCKCCNSSKNNKTLEEYLSDDKLVLPQILEYASNRGITLRDVFLQTMIKCSISKKAI